MMTMWAECRKVLEMQWPGKTKSGKTRRERCGEGGPHIREERGKTTCLTEMYGESTVAIRGKRQKKNDLPDYSLCSGADGFEILIAFEDGEGRVSHLHCVDLRSTHG